MGFEEVDRSAYVISKLHEVGGTGLGELRGWRSWEISSRASLRAQPQRAVRPQRLLIPRQSAADWVIHDIRIVKDGAASSMIVGAGQGIPGEVFSTANGLDASFEMGAVAALMTIELVVEYVGGNPEGDVFNGVLICEVVDGKGREVVPVNSDNIRIVSAARAGELGSGKRIGIQIDDRAWVFRQNRATTPFQILIEESPLRFEEPSMERMLYMDADDGDGKVLRSGEPEPIGPRIQVPIRVETGPGGAWRAQLEVSDLHAVRPRVLSLHVLESPRRVLFGLDETTNQVVFEIAIGRGSAPRDGSLFGRFDKNGYVPTWWELATAFDQVPAPLRDGPGASTDLAVETGT